MEQADGEQRGCQEVRAHGRDVTKERQAGHGFLAVRPVVIGGSEPAFNFVSEVSSILSIDHV
jgi:hypothetical protein